MIFLILFLIVYGLFDLGITYYGLTSGKAVELNPLVNGKPFYYFIILKVILSAILIGVVYFLIPAKYQESCYAFLAIIGCGLFVYNLSQLRLI